MSTRTRRDAYALTDDQRDALDLTPEQAARCAALAREIGPLSAEQRDQLAVLLASAYAPRRA